MSAEAVVRRSSTKYRSSCPEVFYKKGVFKNFTKFTGKHLCQTLAQVFSCKFYEIFKIIFFYRTPPVATSKIRPQI